MLKRTKQEKIRMFSVPQNCVTVENWRVDGFLDHDINETEFLKKGDVNKIELARDRTNKLEGKFLTCLCRKYVFPQFTHKSDNVSGA